MGKSWQYALPSAELCRYTPVVPSPMLWLVTVVEFLGSCCFSFQEMELMETMSNDENSMV
jgi:hypothetical protein